MTKEVLYAYWLAIKGHISSWEITLWILFVFVSLYMIFKLKMVKKYFSLIWQSIVIYILLALMFFIALIGSYSFDTQQFVFKYPHWLTYILRLFAPIPDTFTSKEFAPLFATFTYRTLLFFMAGFVVINGVAFIYVALTGGKRATKTIEKNTDKPSTI